MGTDRIVTSLLRFISFPIFPFISFSLCLSEQELWGLCQSCFCEYEQMNPDLECFTLELRYIICQLPSFDHFTQCLWCPSKPPSCLPYPVGTIIPSNSYCSLDNARWGVCWGEQPSSQIVLRARAPWSRCSLLYCVFFAVNYKILLIVMGCVAVFLLIAVPCCIYCCCCRSKKNKNKSAFFFHLDVSDLTLYMKFVSLISGSGRKMLSLNVREKRGK